MAEETGFRDFHVGALPNTSAFPNSFVILRLKITCGIVRVTLSIDLDIPLS